jgi:putative redox protein
MSERVVVYQDKSFRTEFKAGDPNDPDSNDVETIMHLHELTPYGMLLASLASCTAIVVNSYARNHTIPLKGVTVEASYARVFAEDCDDCDEDNQYEEVIQKSIRFEGDLDSQQLDRLHRVAKACSVRRLLEKGIRVVDN